MANESLGGIAWYVDADTSPAVDSVEEMAKQVNSTTKELGKLDKAAEKTVKETNKLSKAASGVKQGLKGASRGAGQAGIQIQQFVGQIQGGQSAMLAFSQQSADLGFVLGFPLLGAVSGIAASMAGILLPELFKSTSALEGMEKATESLKAVLTLSKGGIAEYSDKMRELAEISELLARTKLYSAIAEQQESIKKGTKGIQDAIEDIGTNSLLYGRSLETYFGKMSSSANRAVLLLKDAANAISMDGVNTETANQMAEALSEASSAGLDTTEKGRELSATLTSLVRNIYTTDKSIDEMRKTLQGSGSDIEEVTDKSEKYDAILKSLSVKTDQLKSKQLELQKSQVLEKAAADNVSKSKREQISDAYDNVIAIEKEKEAIKEKRKEQSESRKQDIEASKKAREQQKESLKSARGNISNVKMNTKVNIAEGTDPTEARQAAISRLEELRDKDVQNEEQYNREIANLRLANLQDQQKTQDSAQQFAEQIADRGMSEYEIRKQEMDKLSELYDQGLINESEYQDSLTQIRKEGDQARLQSSQMALSGFANAFDTMAQVMADAKGKQSSEYKAMFAISKAFAIAQAGLNLSLAISQALADPSALTLPQKLANYAAIASAGATLVSQVASASYQGRENGGAVMANQTYEMGERNKPELLVIPGNNGKVFSNSDVKQMMGGGGSGGGFRQTIINQAPGVDVQTNGDGITAEQVVLITKSEMSNPNSRTRRAAQSTSNIKTKPLISRG